MKATQRRDERKAELERLSATDQGRFQLAELLNRYRGQSARISLPSGARPVIEILECEFGPTEDTCI